MPRRSWRSRPTPRRTGSWGRQEADRRNTDRMITGWLAFFQPRDGSPALANRLSPAEKAELETFAATLADTEADPKVYNRILRGLRNYNSQVRLKWARAVVQVQERPVGGGLRRSRPSPEPAGSAKRADPRTGAGPR